MLQSRSLRCVCVDDILVRNELHPKQPLYYFYTIKYIRRLIIFICEPRDFHKNIVNYQQAVVARIGVISFSFLAGKKRKV